MLTKIGGGREKSGSLAPAAPQTFWGKTLENRQ
jgi:hypothetical protein